MMRRVMPIRFGVLVAIVAAVPPHELIGRGGTGAVTRAFAEKKGGA